MDLETMPRRGRRAVALAGLVLAAVVTVAGCDGDGKAASDSAKAGATATATASATPSPEAPTASGTPTGSSSASPTADPTAGASTAPDQPGTAPKPTLSSPATVPPAPRQPPASPPATPPGNGIAVGEPDPNGVGARPAVTYRVDGSNKLTVYFYGGVCQKYALKADESHAGRVDVRIVVAEPVQPGQVCTALAKRQTVTADLRQPLAGRTVTDQSNGQEVPLEGDPHMGPDPVTPDVAGR
ncbi:hypothetical protein [Kitasatospora sp. NPDC097643]|uniref:hypothetical protein n=1 Tax=Kitasatospora sp. NPDC097643 TaxID=3157230 RepID=UPI00332D3278